MMDKYTTTRGKTVTFRGIATLLDKLQAQHKTIAPPTYTVVSKITGVTETFPHDATTVQTDDEKAAWEKYVAEKLKAELEYNQALTRLVLLRGIEFEYDANGDWQAEQKFLGIAIPDDPIERKLHYIETELIGGVSDVENIMLGVMAASGVSEELLAAMASSFRGALVKPAGDETRGPADSEVKPDVVLQPTVRDGAGSVGVKNADEPIRRARRRG